MGSRKDRAQLESRREFPRVSSNCPLKFQKLKNVPTQLQSVESQDAGVINNISGGGICFTNEAAMEEGEMLALEMDLPGFPTSVISMGKVAWCRPSEESAGAWDIGVSFWWVGWRDNQAQQKISDWITQSLDD